MQQHRDRNALIKSLAPTKYTLIGLDANNRSWFDSYGTMWVGAADYLNYNPYVCFVADPSTCDYAWEDHVLQVAESLGPDTVREQLARVLAQLEERFPEAAALLEDAELELLAFTCFPKEHWRQLWSNNSLERLNKEIRRRTDVAGIFLRVFLLPARSCRLRSELWVTRHLSVEPSWL